MSSFPYDFAQSADYLEHAFGSNIEDVFNGMQRDIDSRHPGFSLWANVHKPCLVEAMRRWFADIHQHHSAESYRQFASEIVQPGDRVITFNYDVSLESKLRAAGKWAIGDGYGFAARGLPTGSTVKVFKLHGSINWLAVLFDGLMSGVAAFSPNETLGTRPAFTDADLTALGYSGIIDPRFPRGGAAALNPMVFPTSRKRFYFQSNLGREWEGFWERLWRGAKRAVQSSERVIICGYGMYPVDRRGCNLLLTGEMPGEIQVCCGNDSERIVEQLRSRGRNALVADQVFFQDWVAAHADRNTVAG